MSLHSVRKSTPLRVCLGLAGLLGTSGIALAQKAPSGPMCTSSAWTGTVSYSRTHSHSDNKTVYRVSGRGRDTTQFEMNYRYKAVVAVLESPAQDGSNIAKASVSHTMTSKETTTALESNSCDRGKTWQQMSGSFSNEQKTTGEGRDDANVTIGVHDDGTYTVGVAAPRIKGKISGSQKSSFSGQCTKKEGKTLNYPETETSVEGGSLVSTGNRVDPTNPTHLSGSYSQTNLNITETITWNLEKCGAPLRVTDLTFEDMKFPTWDNWQNISEQRGTIDGNWVRIKATVLNASAERRSGEITFKETYKGDKWDGARPDAPLKDQSAAVSLEPGEAKEVEILWDSSGYAWFDDGRPRLVQRVKAELRENDKLVDNLTRNLKIAPKPLVLVHGPWSNWAAFEAWQNILTTSHSYDWKAFPVGEKAQHGSMNSGREIFSTEQSKSTGENADGLESYIKYAQEDRNAWHVDVVAHSTGGVVSRWYIDQRMPAAYPDGRPQITHLVMLGTPNMGTPCAEVMNFAFEMATGKSLHVMREITELAMNGFNRVHKNRKGVQFSTLAGNALPTMCKSIVWNDGFVPVESAHWTIADRGESKSLHPDLLGTRDFSGFVKPHLAIGPRGNHGPALTNLRSTPGDVRQGGLNDTDARFFAVANRPATYRMDLAAATQDEPLRPDFAKAVKLAPKQSLDIDIPVTSGLNFGITFMAAQEVSATLYDDKGALVGKNLTGTPEANTWFRSIFIDKPVNGGTWKLRLQSTANRPTEAVVAGWTNALKPGAKGGLVAQR
jgi:pimeloyl-ACP methyl ester carboxylesterase